MFESDQTNSPRSYSSYHGNRRDRLGKVGHDRNHDPYLDQNHVVDRDRGSLR